MVENYARRLQSQGLNINDYMKYTGMTPEKLMEQMRPEAEKRIKTRLVLEKVVEVENVEVSDEKLDEQINEIAASYKLEGAKLKEMMGEREKEQIREDPESSGSDRFTGRAGKACLIKPIKANTEIRQNSMMS